MVIQLQEGDNNIERQKTLDKMFVFLTILRELKDMPIHKNQYNQNRFVFQSRVRPLQLKQIKTISSIDSKRGYLDWDNDYFIQSKSEGTSKIRYTNTDQNYISFLM
ncbi:hypothetical protein pb186bvf_003161 [Paramecium bursaria]